MDLLHSQQTRQQRDNTLPYLTLRAKEGMWGDCCIWLHSAQIQERHQDCSKHIYINMKVVRNTYFQLTDVNSKVCVINTRISEWRATVSPYSCSVIDLFQRFWPPGNIMRAFCSIWSALCLCLLLSSLSISSCWLRQKWQSAVEYAKFGSWDRFLCSCKVNTNSHISSPTFIYMHSSIYASKFYLPLLVELEERLVLSGTQHQEINEQEHAKWVRVWVQTTERTAEKTTSLQLQHVMNPRTVNLSSHFMCLCIRYMSSTKSTDG